MLVSHIVKQSWTVDNRFRDPGIPSVLQHFRRAVRDGSWLSVRVALPEVEESANWSLRDCRIRNPWPGKFRRWTPALRRQDANYHVRKDGAGVDYHGGTCR